MMHEHDTDLIAAIAEGEMSPAEQTAAEASLETCEACRTDLQLQREALALLRSTPRVEMTDLERAAVHREVARRLGPAPRDVQVRPKAPWFQRLMPAMAAAAALLVVVGVGSVLINEPGADQSAAETTAAVAADGGATSVAEELAEMSGALDGEADQATTTAPAFAAPNVSAVQDYGPVSRTDLADIAAQMKMAEPAETVTDYSADSLRSLETEPALVCVDAAIGEGTVTAIGRAIVDGEPVEIYRSDGTVVVYSTADCSLIDRFE